jgi:hypothetical protein
MKLVAALVLIACGSAAADPAPIGHVITAPTAWLPPEGGLVASAGIDQRGDGGFRIAYGLGGIAAVELGKDSDMRACTDPCAERTDKQPSSNGHMGYTMGVGQDGPRPAIALGFLTTFDKASLKAVDLHLVASYAISGVRIHAGVAAIQSRVGDATSGVLLRPSLGFELTPPQYRKTTLMGDFAYLPLLDASAPTVEWTAGWGVRYQAFQWSSIELDVRHRESEGLGDSTVMVRVNALVR